MRQQRRAGEKLFIDFAGSTVPLTDGKRAQVFVSAMGASSYTFACATEAQKLEDWIGSMVRALAFYGGVPQLARARTTGAKNAVIADPAGRPLRAARRARRCWTSPAHYGTSVRKSTPGRLGRPPACRRSATRPPRRARSKIGMGSPAWILARLAPATCRFDTRGRGRCGASPSLLRPSLNERPFQKAARGQRAGRSNAFRRTRRAGADAAAGEPLRDRPLQDRQGAHRLPHRDRRSPLQRAARAGRPDAGGAHHRGQGACFEIAVTPWAAEPHREPGPLQRRGGGFTGRPANWMRTCRAAHPGAALVDWTTAVSG